MSFEMATLRSDLQSSVQRVAVFGHKIDDSIPWRCSKRVMLWRRRRLCVLYLFGYAAADWIHDFYFN